MKNSFPFIAYLALFACFSSADVFAQDSLRTRYSVFAGIGFNTHTADFRALPGIPNCCPRFESGSGIGPLMGLRYELPVSPSLLAGIGVDFTVHSAKLTEQEPVTLISQGTLLNGTFEHTIDASITSFGVSAALGFRVIDQLFLRGGFRAGFPLTKEYAQEERITEPSAAGTFLDSLGNDSGERTRNVSSGDIPSFGGVLLHALIGAEYDLPLNAEQTLLLAPGVHFGFGLTNLVSGNDWKAHSLQVSLALKYSPKPSKITLRDTVFIRDTVIAMIAAGEPPRVRLDNRTATTDVSEDETTITEITTVTERYISEIPKPATLVANVKVVGLEAGKEEALPTLRIEEFMQTNTHPLLGYVFFGENSAAVPSRYRSMTSAQAGRFKPEQLFAEDAIGIAHNVLNIIGYNMGLHPEAQLTLTGCNSDNDSEKNNLVLSRKRAETVRNYLISVWHIDSTRLVLQERNLPSTPSNTKTADGLEENRRVEIVSSVPEVTDVLVVNDTTRKVTPPGIRFKLSATAKEGISNWRVSVRQRGVVLREFSGKGAPPATLDWNLQSEQKNVPRFGESLDIDFYAESNGNERTVVQQPVSTQVVTLQQKKQQRAKDYHLDRYNLVLFDVGKADVTPAHQRTLDRIRQRLKPESTITIEGYSDRSGDSEANRKLALGRAKATAAALNRSDATVRGIGEDRLLYSNSTPEGRFYCRTVQIEVRTPVE